MKCRVPAYLPAAKWEDVKVESQPTRFMFKRMIFRKVMENETCAGQVVGRLWLQVNKLSLFFNQLK